MAVILETSLGNLVIDLFTEDAPLACENFLKLCKLKYYNDCKFFDVQKDWAVVTGDPTNTGNGGQSVWGVVKGKEYKYFPPEVNEKRKHNRIGIVSTANPAKNLNGSSFLITHNDKIPTFDGKHTVFGVIEEGLDILDEIATSFVDENNVPLKNIRIRKTHVLDDPFPDIAGMEIPEKSPEPDIDRFDIDYEGTSSGSENDSDEEVEKLKQKEDKQREYILEIVGDIPDADLKPPDNVLFVCKLNPVTEDEALELIFSRFGKINCCDVIRDYKTGDSLQYAFIEFDDKEDARKAYLKMDNVLIDDRRIKVDFSQSVAKFWAHYKRAKKFGGQSQRTMGALDTMRNRANQDMNKRGGRRKLSFEDSGNLVGTMKKSQVSPKRRPNTTQSVVRPQGGNYLRPLGRDAGKGKTRDRDGGDNSRNYNRENWKHDRSSRAPPSNAPRRAPRAPPRKHRDRSPSSSPAAERDNPRSFPKNWGPGRNEVKRKRRVSSSPEAPAKRKKRHDTSSESEAERKKKKKKKKKKKRRSSSASVEEFD